MHNTDVEKWNRIHSSEKHGNAAPARVLTENLHLLPAHGKALDLACGTGANAIELARAGLDVHAWDCSDIALNTLHARAAALALSLSTAQRDIIRFPPEPDSFDIIVVVHFLDRGLARHIIKALRRNGLLFYQTFIKNKVNDSGPSNPDFLLDTNELLELFRGLTIRVYREEGHTGNPDKGLRNEAMLIAEKS